MRELTYDEWMNEAKSHFESPQDIAFTCPSCGYVQSVKECREAGHPESAIGFSCIGRTLGTDKEFGDKTGGPCNYAGGGLIRLNPVKITDKDTSLFEFALEEIENE